MKKLCAPLASLLLMGSAADAAAQLTVAKDGPIVYGHHHLNTTSVEAQKKFFVDTLGGKAVKIGTNNTEIIEFPNVLIFLRAVQAAAGGYRMITDTEAPGREVKDDIAGPLQAGGASIAFALAPDELKVELVEAKQ